MKVKYKKCKNTKECFRYLLFHHFIVMPQIESKKSIDKKIENTSDPSALNAQEVSVVDMFAEGYNPSMPSGGGGGGGGFKDHTARKKAKKKLEDKLHSVQQNILA